MKKGILSYFKKIAKYIKQFWNWLWNDNGVWSWVVLLLLTFLFIKFIFYPGVGLALSTTHPIVAVVSGSMEHDGDFDNWWESTAICGITQNYQPLYCSQEEFYFEYNISYDNFKTFDFPNGFDKGDVMIIYGEKPKDIKVGDVVVWRTSVRSEPIIHRVINITYDSNENRYYFHTKGDHNQRSINIVGFDETKISEDSLVGKAIFRLPKVGYLKLVLTGEAFKNDDNLVMVEYAKTN